MEGIARGVPDLRKCQPHYLSRNRSIVSGLTETCGRLQDASPFCGCVSVQILGRTSTAKWQRPFSLQSFADQKMEGWGGETFSEL